MKCRLVKGFIELIFFSCYNDHYLQTLHVNISFQFHTKNIVPYPQAGLKCE